ncbi:MAG: hypothetical protein HETSPECPRED_009500 [Heterodermia speciosa]|uniref:Uncharacterized protein n=1 Tax=Heterodermia speciosa TaxID=116794 RepID=A0A8H3EQS1_9LECA|nr:MAG: hypothetical protein HETSPECPRED_009500 [Heterodermia speciosa]
MAMTMYFEFLPLTALYSILLNFSTQIVALRTTIHLPPAPLRRLNASLAEPQPLRCYTEEDASFPVDEHVCKPVIERINARRDRSRYINVKGVDCPLAFTAPGTPCEINLESQSPRAEDRFTPRAIGERALMILDECEYESFGGVAAIGYRGFVVRVDSGLEGWVEQVGEGGNNGTGRG